MRKFYILIFILVFLSSSAIAAENSSIDLEKIKPLNDAEVKICLSDKDCRVAYKMLTDITVMYYPLFQELDSSIKQLKKLKSALNAKDEKKDEELNAKLDEMIVELQRKQAIRAGLIGGALQVTRESFNSIKKKE